MYSRLAITNIVESLQVRRVVHLTGARQCGKTTLAESLDLPNKRSFTLDNLLHLESAKSDPEGFVRRNPGETLLIDEVQKVPELLNAIKIQVDHNNERGQYLLTGSSNLHFAKCVRDSLAGRLHTVCLRTLLYSELMGGHGEFLQHAFAEDFPSMTAKMSKRDVIHFAFCGGYPEALDLKWKHRLEWYVDYLDNLIMKDLRDVTEIRKLDLLRTVCDWLLAHSGKFFEMNGMCTQAHVSKDTALNYIAALKSLYLFDAVSPWTNSEYSRIGKRTKYYSSDSGLMANLLGWKEENAYFDDDASGKLIETWVCHQLLGLCGLSPEYRLTQYRDSDKHEIDFVIEDNDGGCVGVEVKAGSAIGVSDFRHLKWFNATFKPRHFVGIVLHSGSDVLRFGEHMYAVPFTALGV